MRHGSWQAWYPSFMRLEAEGGNVLEIEPAKVGSGIPGVDDDVLVNVHVQAHGFSGTTDVWILRDAWESFLRELADLERTRARKCHSRVDQSG